MTDLPKSDPSQISLYESKSDHTFNPPQHSTPFNPLHTHTLSHSLSLSLYLSIYLSIYLSLRLHCQYPLFSFCQWTHLDWGASLKHSKTAIDCEVDFNSAPTSTQMESAHHTQQTGVKKTNSFSSLKEDSIESELRKNNSIFDIKTTGNTILLH